MNRSDLKKLAAMRLSDAKALLRTRRNNAGAYYVAGYAIECALKVCIAKQQGQYPFPPKLREKELNENFYTHNLIKLLETAGLSQQLGVDRAANARLDANWSNVISWSEAERYQANISRNRAETLVKAIDDPKDGVLEWLKQYW